MHSSFHVSTVALPPVPQIAMLMGSLTLRRSVYFASPRTPPSALNSTLHMGERGAIVAPCRRRVHVYFANTGSESHSNWRVLASRLRRLPGDLLTYLPTYRPTYLPTDLPTYLPAAPTYLPTDRPTELPTDLPTDLLTYLPTYLPTYLLTC